MNSPGGPGCTWARPKDARARQQMEKTENGKVCFLIGHMVQKLLLQVRDTRPTTDCFLNVFVLFPGLSAIEKPDTICLLQWYAPSDYKSRLACFSLAS